MSAVINHYSVSVSQNIFFLPRGEKLGWRIFFLHFISRIFIARFLLSLAYKKQTLPLVGWSKKYLGVK
jgi:hypothetical protein